MRPVRQVRLVVAQHVEIAAHRRMERHVFEQSRKLPKAFVEQHVVVIAERVGALIERPVFGDDHDLAERKGDALAELIRRR